ncbi:MAG: hypothetical protein ACI86M_002571 [Saprospiraceae bacterium]|jgi:hypothetical protein
MKNTAILALLLFSPTPIISKTINLGIHINFEAFTGTGAAKNSGTSKGDIGSNNGMVSGFEDDDFIGKVYNADSITAQTRIDLLRLYIHLNYIFVTYPSTHAAALGTGETAIAVKDANVQLNWVTATEISNDYITVEYSEDGIYFSPISKITGAGNSAQSLAYTAIDHSPLDGISYYRLKQTNYDGRTNYSRIIKEEFKNTKNYILGIYPNPFSNATTSHTNENLKDYKLIAYYPLGQLGKQIINISGQTFSFQRNNLSDVLYSIR